MPRLFSLFRLPSKLRRRARRSRIVTMLLLLIVVSTVLAPLYCIYKPPSFVIRYFKYKWPDVLWEAPTSSKVVALTIDDAPSEYTREIMAILKEYDAAATFFIIGSQVPGHEDILQDLVRNGNELGNHAMRDEPSRSLDDDTLAEQIETIDEMLNKAYRAVGEERPAKYFRPGSGFFSQRMRALVTKMGYQLVLGSIYPHDPQIPYWRVNARHILSMIRPGGIIICHDRRSWTPPMLRKVLARVRERGYRVVTVTEILRQTNI